MRALVAVQVLEVEAVAGEVALDVLARPSIWMTLAPMSASWRTQVGPERARVRSITVYGESGSVIAILRASWLGRQDRRAGLRRRVP